MSQVGVRDLKNQLSRYLKRVQEGEEIPLVHDPYGRDPFWVALGPPQVATDPASSPV